MSVHGQKIDTLKLYKEINQKVRFFPRLCQ